MQGRAGGARAGARGASGGADDALPAARWDAAGAATSEQDVTSTGAGKANSISGMEQPLPFLVCART